MRSLTVGVLLTILSALPLAHPPATFVITNVTVIDGAGAAPRRADVVVRGESISAIAPVAAVPPGTTVVDGTGRFLIPGLWDMHAHLALRPEPMLAEKVSLPLFLVNGVVGVRDMGGPLDTVVALRTRVSRGEIAGPRILTPGPFMDGPGETSPMFRRPADTAAAAAAVAELAAAGADFVKVQSGLAPDVHAALARAAQKAHVALAGHIPLSMNAADIIASGQRSIEHISPALVGDGMLLFGCSSNGTALLTELRAIESERSKSEPAALAQREAALRKALVDTYDPNKARALGRSIGDHPVWIVPTLIFSASLRPLTRSDDGTDLPMAFVPAAMRTRWMDRRKQFIARQTDETFAATMAVAATAARAVRDLEQGGARMLAGTDTFDAFVLPGHSLHQELALLVEAGFTPLEALQTATKNAAEYRGTSKTEGTIARGKRADLVLLDADPTVDIHNTRRVHAVVLGGTVYGRDALDRLLAGVRAFAAQ
jgi:hypothetical protein